MSKSNKKPSDNNIINFYEIPAMKEFMYEYPNPNFALNQMKTPFMSVVCSATGGGKTNMVMNLLRRFDNTFKHIYIVNQESEPLYDFLQKNIPKGLTITHKLSDCPDFKQLGEQKKDQTLFIFDDLVKTKNQDYIETLYKRGRKCGCSCIYIL
jgi:threonine dehydratase